MSLYTDLIEAGVPVSNWCSDLYFPRTAQTTEILARHPLQRTNATVFKSNTDGVSTYDVPFAYDLFFNQGKL